MSTLHRRMSPRSLVVIAVALLAGCDAAVLPPRPDADVYEYRLALDPPETLRWPAGERIHIHVVEDGPDADLLRTAAERGARAWNAYALLDEYELVVGASADDADVVLAWSNAALPVETSACPPTAGRAQTTFCLDGNRLFRYPATDGGASRVTMLVTIATLLAGAPDALDNVSAHELGHVLGIARHSDDPDDLMFTDPMRAQPSQRDIATVRALYRAPADILP
jgi:predicted Zn-dependent protease